MNTFFARSNSRIRLKNSFFRTSKLIGLFILLVSCKSMMVSNYSKPKKVVLKSKVTVVKFMTGADNLKSHLNLFENKKVGIVTNQTGLVSYDSISQKKFDSGFNTQKISIKTVHLVDYITEKTPIELVKIFAPEHGFRGTADAGEYVDDTKGISMEVPIERTGGADGQSKSIWDVQKLIIDANGKPVLDNEGQPMYTDKYSFTEKVANSNWDVLGDAYYLQDDMAQGVGTALGFVIGGKGTNMALNNVGKGIGKISSTATKALPVRYRHKTQNWGLA